MIRRTLGWSDADASPLHERIRLSYADFEAAGISRTMIKSADAEAIQMKFIRRVRDPRAKSAGTPAVSGLHELNWDERPPDSRYIIDPLVFQGFFAGDGNRMYIPNQCFDVVVSQETLAVAKVVGAVARHSISFQNKWGHRRTFASLSYTRLQRYAKIADRESLAAALRTAIERNYLQRVEEGYSDARGGGRASRVATYALKWLNHARSAPIGAKTPPA